MHRSGCLLPQLKDGVTPRLRGVQDALLEFLTGMRKGALSVTQGQVHDVLSSMSVSAGGLGVALVPSDLTREAMCVGGLLDVWPWLVRMARDYKMQHLFDALTEMGPVQEVAEGEPPTDRSILRNRLADLNTLVGTVMTAITKYGSLEAEGLQDNMGIAGYPVPAQPLVPAADLTLVAAKYCRVWDAARTSELLGSPVGKAARMELCGGATEDWRLEVKDLRSWVTLSLAGEQPAVSAVQAVKSFLEGAAGGHNQSRVTALAERAQVERLLWDASSPLSNSLWSDADAVTREYAGVARASMRASRCEFAGSWLHAPLPLLNHVHPEDARGMFCQRLAIPQPCSLPPEPLGETRTDCGDAWRLTQICPGCHR